MAVSSGYVELLKDLLAGLGPITVKRMFGGAGVYADGVMFGLIADDTLFLKVDDKNEAGFESEGLERFRYEGKARPIEMSYRRAPERLFDDDEEMCEWASGALAAARRAKAKKPAAKTTGKRKSIAAKASGGRASAKKRS